MGLSKAVIYRLGTLLDLAELTLAEVIRVRGGNASNVNEAGHWARLMLAEVAEAAVAGDKSADKALKIAKQASRLGRKYGRDKS